MLLRAPSSSTPPFPPHTSPRPVGSIPGGAPQDPIDWVDGDGSYLVACHLPGMLEWVHKRAQNSA